MDIHTSIQVHIHIHADRAMSAHVNVAATQAAQSTRQGDLPGYRGAMVGSSASSMLLYFKGVRLGRVGPPTTSIEGLAITAFLA